MKFKIWKEDEKKSGKKTDTSTATKSHTTQDKVLEPKVESKESMTESIDPMELESLRSTFITISKLDYHDHPVYTGIVMDPTARGGKKYMIVEPTFTARDKKNYEALRQILMTELTIDLNDITSKKVAEKRLKRKIINVIKKYKIDIPPGSIHKIIYYAIRNFIYLGSIEPLMHDPMIEEISCNGVNIPIYVYHREYESLPTNIIFEDEKELENYVRKLAYVSGHHISLAQPIVDASLPGGDRINLTLGTEVTKKGSTFTVRRFRTDPVSIVNLIQYNTMSADMAAYLWYLVEHRSTLLVAGGTASGKTTTLNTISSFIPPQQKIVTIEDTQELNLHHENWIPAVSRQTFTGSSVQEISQFDLLRAALRQRPDIIIVGETRGKEAYTLFQAMATGHGGFSSIHADSVVATLNRLTSAPMDIPKVLIANTLNAIILQLKLTIGNKSVRRITQISEIVGLDENSGEVLLNDVFNWNPISDKQTFSGRSILFDKIGGRYGETTEQITYDLNKKKTAIDWMIKNDIKKHKDVSDTIRDYYADPDRFYERRRMLL